MKTLKILYINGGPIDFGGISSYMINYYQCFDREKIHVDFIVHGMEEGAREQMVRDMGSEIYHIPTKRENLLKNMNDLKKILKSGEYKIIHSHMDGMNGYILKQAKDLGVPIRISHSHNTQHLTNNKFKMIIHEYMRKMIPQYATHLLACSEAAGRWLYGDKLFDAGRVRIIKNAIELKKFIFQKNSREVIRKELNMEDCFLVGHIGRFDDQKNHKFLLEVFSEILKINKKSRLILVGDGHLKNDIEEQIRSLGIESKVKLLGQRDDVNLLINAFDVFVLPSIFEGLPVVAIEAQANGLNCIFSSQITEEVRAGEKCFFYPLELSKKVWAENIACHVSSNLSRDIAINLLKEKGCDIETEARKLQEFYLSLQGVRQ